MPAFTWVATANVVVHCGATPVFVDILEDSYNLNPEKVVAALTPRTRAIIVVHMFGLCAEMDALKAVLPARVAVIEDAACAAGGAYKGRPAGSLGDVACFSLHPRKSVTCGEGGVLTTNDSDLAARAQMYRNHGASVSEEARHRGTKPYELPDFKVFGFNYRLSDIQAAVAVVQLGETRWLSRRARQPRRAVELSFTMPTLAPNACASSSLPTCAAGLRCARRRGHAPASRNEILAALHCQGIAGRPGTHSVVALDVYRRTYGTDPADFPVATRVAARSIALPLHNHMALNDIERVVTALEHLR